MKKALGILVSCALVNLAEAQTISPAGATAVGSPAATPWAVASRDADSSVWQRQTYDRGPNGTVVTNVHRVVELATGLNHLLGNGQWVPSTENIVISADGSSAMATNGAHQIFLPGDIAGAPIRLITPEGLTIQSEPIALTLSDGSNSVILATLTNSTGAILPSGNQVIYRNALPGL